MIHYVFNILRSNFLRDLEKNVQSWKKCRRILKCRTRSHMRICVDLANL